MFTGLPNLSLISNALRRGGGAAFDPLSLEPVWMADFADTDTMYLTSAGSTKASADGDTVGTLLEVSQWGGVGYDATLATQADKIADYELDAPATWGGTADKSTPGQITVSGSNSVTPPENAGGATYSESYVVGGLYRVEWDHLAFSGGLIFAALGSTINYNVGNAKTMMAKASSPPYTSFRRWYGDANIAVTKYRIRPIPGLHQQQGTVAACPKWYSPNILRFDGTDDALPGLPAPSASGTIALKMKATTANRVVMGCQNATPNRCYLGTDSSGQLAGAIGSDGFATIHGSTDIVTSPVTGVAILTWDATGGVQLYWNGTQVYTGSLSGSIPTATTMTLGGLNNNGTPASYFAGDVIGTPIVLDSYANAATAAQLTTYLS